MNTSIITDDEKLVCMERIFDMNAHCTEFWAFRSYSHGDIAVHCKLTHDFTKVEIKVDAPTLIEAVNEAYTRFCRVLNRLPELDSLRTLEHRATACGGTPDEETPSPVNLDNEIPF